MQPNCPGWFFSLALARNGGNSLGLWRGKHIPYLKTLYSIPYHGITIAKQFSIYVHGTHWGISISLCSSAFITWVLFDTFELRNIGKHHRLMTFLFTCDCPKTKKNHMACIFFIKEQEARGLFQTNRTKTARNAVWVISLSVSPPTLACCKY